jgi:hypothetical protein
VRGPGEREAKSNGSHRVGHFNDCWRGDRYRRCVVGRFSLSWSAVIAGAFAAMAITFIVISLGTGIGLAVASPYHTGPSATSLTLAGAVWLVMAQALGFGCGGYLATRVRPRFADDLGRDAGFRDAARGLVVWALGVAAAALLVFVAASLPLRALTNSSPTASAETALSGSPSARSNTGPADYYVDMLFRPNPGSQPTAAPGQGVDQSRAEASRIILRSIPQGQLSGDDRTYLAQLVARGTGLSEADATRRVSDVEKQAIDDAKRAADKAAKAGAFLSFWTFMSLLFGGAAATLGGIFGGESREPEAAWAPTVQPR